MRATPSRAGVRPRGVRVAAGLAVLAVLAVAVVLVVGRGDAPAEPPEAIPSPEPDPDPDPEPLPALTLAAPADCATNPYCLDALARVYRVDVSEALRTVEPGAPVVAALRAGEADVGVLFTADPLLDDPDLVVLEDDQGMLAAEHLVPIAPAALVEGRGDGLRTALDAISARLTTADLQTLTAVARGGDALDAAVTDLVDGWGLAGVEVADGPALRLGAQAFDTDVVVSELYAAGLRAQGIDAEVVALDGFRALEIAAMLDGELDVVVDYLSSLLEYLNGFTPLATADADETHAVLRALLAAASHEAFALSEAASTNAFVVTADTAARYGLGALSDLGPGFPVADPPPPPGERPEVLEPLVLFGDDALGVGDTGPAVLALQDLLAAAGYDPGPRNGIFDEPTRRAVAAFQRDAGLAPDGIVRPATLAALDAAAAAGGLPTVPEAGGDGAGVDPPLAPEPDDGPAPTGAVVHLTFDDGPNGSFTPRILDLLARYDAQAVFFMIGQQVESGAALVRRAVADGHRIGNHSWSHPSLVGLSRTAFDQEIGRTQDVMEAVAGRRPTCLRPPYGAMDANTRDWALDAGLTTVLWDIDPQDWARPGVDAIVRSVVDYATTGDVVLFHDGGGNRDQTVAALEQILERLAARGFAFTVAPGC